MDWCKEHPLACIGLLLAALLVIVMLTHRCKSEGFTGDGNVVSEPISSYYKSFRSDQYGKDAMVVGLHYTDWCGYCKLMKPVWNKLKDDLSKDPNYSGIMFVENNEEENPLRGISGYPTIIRYRGGKAQKYDGRAEYEQLKRFVLSPLSNPTFGARW